MFCYREETLIFTQRFQQVTYQLKQWLKLKIIHFQLCSTIR